MTTTTLSVQLNCRSENNTRLSTRGATERQVLWSNSRLKATERQPPSLGGDWQRGAVTSSTNNSAHNRHKEQTCLPGAARSNGGSPSSFLIGRNGSSNTVKQLKCFPNTDAHFNCEVTQLMHNSAHRWGCSLAQKRRIRSRSDCEMPLSNGGSQIRSSALFLSVWPAAFTAN